MWLVVPLSVSALAIRHQPRWISDDKSVLYEQVLLSMFFLIGLLLLSLRLLLLSTGFVFAL